MGVGVDGAGVSSPFLSNECRLLDRYELQQELVNALEKTKDHRHLASRCIACHRSFRHWRCDQGHDTAEAENSCSVRVCPHCSHRRAKILGDRITKFLLGRESSGLRYAVLAERNSEDLKAGIDSLWRAWTRLRRSVQWKRKVKGCIVALEVTYNAEEATWHPHLNVLMEGEYFPFEELKQAWMEVSDGQTAFIRAADAGTVHELMKYVTKISQLDPRTGKEIGLISNPPALDSFLSAIEKRRLVRTYGTFYGLTVEDEEQPGQECSVCGSSCMVKLGHVHPSQVGFDFEKQAFYIRKPDPSRIKWAAQESESFDPAHIAADYRRACERLELAREAKSFQKFRNLITGFAATSRIGEQHHGNSTSRPSAGS